MAGIKRKPKVKVVEISGGATQMVFKTKFNYKPDEKLKKTIEPETQDYIRVVDKETKEITLEPNGKTNVKEMIEAELPNVMNLNEAVERHADGLRPIGGVEAAHYGDTTKEPSTKAEARKMMLETEAAKATLSGLQKEQEAIFAREAERQKQKEEKGEKE